MDRTEARADHVGVTDGMTPSVPDLPRYWWLRLLLELSVVGAVVVIGHALSGFPGVVLRSLPYVVGALVVFVVAMQRMRGTRAHLTLKNVTVAALMAYAWPVTIAIWLLAIHRSGSGPTNGQPCTQS
jgi:hypothetical protein